MKLSQLAAITWTIRDFTQTEEDLARSFARLREIGYTAVQVSSTPVDYAAIARILVENDMVCCSTHEGGQMILDEPGRVAERVATLGCKTTAYPYPGGIALKTADDAKRFAARLNAAGAIMREHGVQLCYHNHALEFARDGVNPPMLEIIFNETDPALLHAELDTYWVQAGGGSPVEWCQRLRGRLPVLHMKDYVVDAEQKPHFAEIGRGNLNFKNIIAAATSSGCKWFVVEQDTCPGDPFDSLATSFAYVRDHLATA